MKNRGCVLIVDDDENIGRLISRHLRALGYACETASNGQAGLEALKTGRFDVALIDLFMPGMSGLEMLRAQQDAGIETVSIVLSAYGDIAKAVEATRLGAFDFLEKPSSPQGIERAIERALKHQEAFRQARKMAALARQWEAMFDAMPDLMLVLDREGRILRCNRALAAQCGIPKENLVGILCSEAPWSRESSLCQCPFTRNAENEAVVSTECAMWGRTYELTSAPLVDASGTAWGSMHIARDISRRKNTERALQEAHAETERLLASMSSILIGVDAQGRITQWNQAAESAFGIPSAQALETPFLECPIVWDKETVRKQIESIVGNKQPTRLEEIPYIRPDGNEGILGLTFNAIVRETGERAGFLLLGADIAERKFLEAQLTQAQKLEAIGHLAAGIAHEINTPTQYVGDNLRFLQESFKDIVHVLGRYQILLEAAEKRLLNAEIIAKAQAVSEKADVPYLITEIPQAIGQSLEGVRRVANIVRSMKEFSHPGGEEKSDIDINRAIENTVTVSRNEWKYVADLSTELDPALPTVPCLPGELNQVILNLIVNAAHAIADVVGDGSQGKGKITIRTRQDGGWVEIRISDTGTGIPPSARDKIFSPFFTTKTIGKGTGQGLAISWSVIVDKHQGTIHFETEEGKGTTFIIRLPLQARQEAL